MSTCLVLMGFSQENRLQEDYNLDLLVNQNVKVYDVYLGKIKTPFCKAEAWIRTIKKEKKNHYYFQLEQTTRKCKFKKAISYDELKKLLIALEDLQVEFMVDKKLKPDFLQNRYMTKEGLCIGYYVEKNTTRWYVQLEPNRRDKVVLVRKVNKLEKILRKGFRKIRLLKQV